MRRLVVGLAVAVALAGCAHVTVFAQPQAIASHAVALRGAGTAQVEVEQGGTVAVATGDLVDVTIPGDEQSHLWGLFTTGTPDQTQKLPVGTLVAGCGPDRPGGDCLAARVRGPIRIGTQRRLDPAQLGIGLFGALTAVVGTTCLAICSRRSDWAYVGTALGYVVMIVPLTTVF
jgi:hypothetical protein